MIPFLGFGENILRAALWKTFWSRSTHKYAKTVVHELAHKKWTKSGLNSSA